MEILQPYNNDTLQLISDNSDYTFTYDNLTDGVIKISVFGDNGFFVEVKSMKDDLTIKLSYDNQIKLILKSKSTYEKKYDAKISDIISTIDSIFDNQRKIYRKNNRVYHNEQSSSNLIEG